MIYYLETLLCKHSQFAMKAKKLKTNDLSVSNKIQTITDKIHLPYILAYRSTP